MTEPFERQQGLQAFLPPGLLGPVIQRRGETLERLIRLLDAPPHRRPELAGSEAFRDLGLAELLLAQAAAAQPAHLLFSDELARLAFAIAEPLRDQPWVSRANDVKARACVLAGNSRRLARETDEADTMFRKAVFHLMGPPDCLERAFYCRHLALLREDQGQLDDAVGLLWRAAQIYRDNQRRGEEGLCLTQLGFLFLEEEQVERALPPLADARQALDPQAQAAAYIQASLGLAYCHAVKGEVEAGRRLVESARPFQRGLPREVSRLIPTWWEGKVLALTGSSREALQLLDRARRGLLKARDMYGAARASLDLGRVLAGLGRADCLERLAKELGKAQPSSFGGIGVLFVFEFFADRVRNGTDVREAFLAAVSRLRCCRRAPVLVMGYWPLEMTRAAEQRGEFHPSLKPTARDRMDAHYAALIDS
ncbi:MAG: hypothetical protein ACJ75H_06090 [Thermoanaerobaculia bacterium]